VASNEQDRIARFLRHNAETRRRATEIAANLPPIPTRDNLTADHPLSRTFGLEEAKRLVDPEPPLYVQQAAKRRQLVLELSLAKRPVREIAEAAGLAYGSTVMVRCRLRSEGKLPPAR
jgi:hypothetical protein